MQLIDQLMTAKPAGTPNEATHAAPVPDSPALEGVATFQMDLDEARIAADTASPDSPIPTPAALPRALLAQAPALANVTLFAEQATPDPAPAVGVMLLSTTSAPDQVLPQPGENKAEVAALQDGVIQKTDPLEIADTPAPKQARNFDTELKSPPLAMPQAAANPAESSPKTINVDAAKSDLQATAPGSATDALKVAAVVKNAPGQPALGQPASGQLAPDQPASDSLKAQTGASVSRPDPAPVLATQMPAPMPAKAALPATIETTKAVGKSLSQTASTEKAAFQNSNPIRAPFDTPQAHVSKELRTPTVAQHSVLQVATPPAIASTTTLTQLPVDGMKIADIELSLAIANPSNAQTSGVTTPASVPAPATAPQIHHIAQQIAGQIAPSNGAANPRDIELRLDPEELGRVRITIQPRDAGLFISLNVERPETLELLRRNADELLTGLREFDLSGATLGFGSDTPQHAQPDTPADTETNDPLILTDAPMAASARRADDGRLDLRL